MNSSYEGYSIEKVFSSKEKAIEYAKSISTEIFPFLSNFCWEDDGYFN